MPIRARHFIVPFTSAAGAFILLGMTAPTSTLGDQALFAALDSDHDGALTQYDVAPLANVIPLLDTDASDTITPEEFRVSLTYADVKMEHPDFYNGDLQPDAWARLEAAEQDARILANTLITMDLSTPGEVRFTTRPASQSEIAQSEFVRVEFIPPEG